MPIIRIPGVTPRRSPSQCQRPHGWLGRLMLRSMNRRHSALTDWGLQHVAIGEGDTILDVGCGGGRTVGKLAALARRGAVHGIDYAAESVAAARRTNREALAAGRLSLQQASVSALPFEAGTFDLVTAVETHFWWEDLGGGLREILRVLKPGGRALVIAEFYNGGRHARYAERLSRWTTMAILDVGQHESMLADAGFEDVRIIEEAERGWICATGVRPA